MDDSKDESAELIKGLTEAISQLTLAIYVLVDMTTQHSGDDEASEEKIDVPQSL